MTDRPPPETVTPPDVVRHSREGKFRRLVNNSPYSIHEIGRDGSVLSMNPAGLRILGVKEQADIRDTPYLSTVSREDRLRVGGLLRQALDGALAEFEFAAINDRQLQCTLLPIFDKAGGVEQVMGLAFDVTDQRLTELSLQQLREGLAVKDDGAARTESARASDRAAYLASRDLREPLERITSAANDLKARHESGLDEEGRRLIAQVANGAHRARSLIDVFLAFSEVEGLEGELRPTSSSDAVDRAMGTLKQAIDDSGAKITVGRLPVVLADTRQIEILFQTLLANAIRFGGASAPEIEVDGSNRGSNCQFSISNKRGPAEAGVVERDFVLLEEIEGTRIPEAGIGLTVCLRVVERHGGRIWVESAESGESTVFFTLPAVAQAETPAAAEGRPRVAG